jgi:hypothetical protein
VGRGGALGIERAAGAAVAGEGAVSAGAATGAARGAGMVGAEVARGSGVPDDGGGGTRMPGAAGGRR